MATVKAPVKVRSLAWASPKAKRDAALKAALKAR